MKFSEMTYTRPDAESTKQHLAALTEQLKACLLYTSFFRPPSVLMARTRCAARTETIITLYYITFPDEKQKVFACLSLSEM